jgi:uncharacterized cupin superfamily protein
VAIAKINVFSSENPGRIDVSRAVGSEATAMYIYDLQPGRSSCPYHYEYEEEWLLVLEGTIVLRVPDDVRSEDRVDEVLAEASNAGAEIRPGSVTFPNVAQQPFMCRAVRFVRLEAVLRDG